MTRRIAILGLILAPLLGGASPPIATYAMSSDSMRPNLEKGDLVGADMLEGMCGQTHPQPGDVVVYRPKDKPQPYLGRVVAGPGQTLRIRRGRLVIDGRTVPAARVAEATGGAGAVVQETLSNGRSYFTLASGEEALFDGIAPVRLGPQDWYILADNRDDATDSRIWGPFETKDICAVATVILQAKDKKRVGAKP